MKTKKKRENKHFASYYILSECHEHQLMSSCFSHLSPFHCLAKTTWQSLSYEQRSTINIARRWGMKILDFFSSKHSKNQEEGKENFSFHWCHQHQHPSFGVLFILITFWYLFFHQIYHIVAFLCNILYVDMMMMIEKQEESFNNTEKSRLFLNLYQKMPKP